MFPVLQPFFLLSSQVARVFRLKDRLIILRTVSLWEDKFLSYKELVGTSLTGHLLKGGSRSDEDVDVHRLDFWLGSIFM